MSTVSVRSDDGQQHAYFLPLAIAWEGHETAIQLSSEWTIAKVREHARVGALVDAFADPAFSLQLVENLRAARDFRAGDGLFEFRPTRKFFEIDARGCVPVQHFSGEQSNTSVMLGETFFLKAYRRLREGPAPEVEMAAYLTEAGFRNCAALAGLVTLDRGSGPVTLMALFEFMRNQGDAWTYTLNHLDRFASIVQDPEQRGEAHELYLNQMRTLGRRIGELHQVLARRSEDPAFQPETVTGADLDAWSQEIGQEAEATLASLLQRTSRLPEQATAPAAELLALREVVTDRIARLRDVRVDGLQKTRAHGDLHLGQILLSEDDFIITDFEGEPARPVAQRRRKHLAMRDVAGMLRSFDYARAVALDRTRTGRPDLEGVIEEALGQWYDLVSPAFLTGYAGAAGTAGGWLSDTTTAETLLRTFQIEKALYELRYELENRPAWAHVPLNGLLALVR